MTDGIGSIRSEGIYLDHNATTPIAPEVLDVGHSGRIVMECGV